MSNLRTMIGLSQGADGGSEPAESEPASGPTAERGSGGEQPADNDDPAARREGTPPEPLRTDIQFDILKNHRRRLVLRYLFDAETPVDVGTLSEHVAAVENDKEPDELDSQERKRSYVGLYQCHIPRMDDADVVDFEKDRGLVALGENADALWTHLEPPADERTEWAERTLVASVVGLGAFLVLQSPAVGGLGLGVVALVVTLVAVGVGAATQVYRRRFGE